MTSVVSNIVSLMAFEIFNVQVPWSRSRTVQGHPRSKVLVTIDGQCGFIFDFHLPSSCYLSPF